MDTMESTIERSIIVVSNDSHHQQHEEQHHQQLHHLHHLYNMTPLPGNVSHQNPYDVPTELICLLAFLYGSISLLAVLGNALVILIIVRNRRMHTITNIFIANLAVADVIIGMFSIPFQFQAALLQRWVLADFMCSLAPMVQVISVNVSIFTLTVIAMDRYIAVLHPFRAGCSPRSAAVIITVTWVLAIGLSLPYALYFWVDYNQVDGREYPWCDLHGPPGFPKFFMYYSCFLVALQYLFPLLVISFCYCRIAWHIWGSRRPGASLNNTEDVRGRNKRKVVKMMIIVVCLFVLCWLPLQTYNLLSVVNDSINLYKFINIIWFCSNWLAMSNSCYNPFIYGILNAKFKREFRQLFSVVPGCRCVARPVKDVYSDYYSEDAHPQHVTRRNQHQYRQAALRYNLCRDQARKLFPLRSVEDRTETSQI